MTTLSERLAELSGKAGEAFEEAGRLIDQQKPIESHFAIEARRSAMARNASAHDALAYELVNAYRAGRLIVKED